MRKIIDRIKTHLESRELPLVVRLQFLQYAKPSLFLFAWVDRIDNTEDRIYNLIKKTIIIVF